MTQTRYAVDNSAILYLALIRRHHTNVYRFTMTMTEPVCPDTLQKAMDHVTPRFPTIIAGFHPGFFEYSMVPAQPPRVMADPGLLRTMPLAEIHRCAWRVYYRENEISIEAFHALTDGYGAVACLTTLVAEYLRLRYHMEIPVCQTLRSLEDEPMAHELEDSYLLHQDGQPLHLPSRYSFQLQRTEGADWAVKSCSRSYPVGQILDASRRCGVSPTSMLSGLMASAIMEHQRQTAPASKKPVRIMIPADLRRMFSSRTLRNFILYALPTMEYREHKLPLRELMCSFQSQIKAQLESRRLASIMAYNVRTQNAPWFRAIPRTLKLAAMRFAYKFFGESNSSITLTNIGNVTLPDEMAPYVDGIQCVLTPRAGSPYNCAVIAANGNLTITLSRFNREPELENRFFSKLEQFLRDEL